MKLLTCFVWFENSFVYEISQILDNVTVCVCGHKIHVDIKTFKLLLEEMIQNNFSVALKQLSWIKEETTKKKTPLLLCLNPE